MPSIEPRSVEKCTCLPWHWNREHRSAISFIRKRFETEPDYVVDSHQFISGGDKTSQYPTPQGPAPLIKEEYGAVRIEGQRFSFLFSKESGRILEGFYDGQALLMDGPELHLGNAGTVTGWGLTSFNVRVEGCEVVLAMTGRCDQLGEVSLTLRIDGVGRIDTGYSYIMPETEGISEIGIVYKLTSDIEKLDWHRRRDRWSYYDENDINRLSGTAWKRRSQGEAQYAKKPLWPWKLDENQYRFGIGHTNHCTVDFSASKKNIYWAQMKAKDGRGCVRSWMETGSVRASVDENGAVRFFVNSS